MNHGYLRKATASQSRMIGPFISDSDGKTTQTALTIANTDVKLSVNGGTGASKNSGGGTHRNNGMYSITLDATDTATVGELTGSVVVSGALPVAFKFMVIEAAIYDSLFAASAAAFDSNQRVSVGTIMSTSAAKLASHIPAVLQGVAAAGGSTTTIVLNSSTGIDGTTPSATDDFYNGRAVVFTSGTLAGQATSITDYVGSTKTLTVVGMTGAPSASDTFVIV